MFQGTNQSIQQKELEQSEQKKNKKGILKPSLNQIQEPIQEKTLKKQFLDINSQPTYINEQQELHSFPNQHKIKQFQDNMQQQQEFYQNDEYDSKAKSQVNRDGERQHNINEQFKYSQENQNLPYNTYQQPLYETRNNIQQKGNIIQKGNHAQQQNFNKAQQRLSNQVPLAQQSKFANKFIILDCRSVQKERLSNQQFECQQPAIKIHCPTTKSKPKQCDFDISSIKKKLKTKICPQQEKINATSLCGQVQTMQHLSEELDKKQSLLEKQKILNMFKNEQSQMEAEWKSIKEKLEKDINQLKDEISKLKVQIKEYEIRNELIQEQKLDLDKKLKICENSKQALLDEKNRYMQEAIENRQKFEATKPLLRMKDAQIEQLECQLKQMQKEKNSISLDYENQRLQLTTLQQKLQDLQNQIAFEKNNQNQEKVQLQQTKSQLQQQISQAEQQPQQQQSSPIKPTLQQPPPVISQVQCIPPELMQQQAQLNCQLQQQYQQIHQLEQLKHSLIEDNRQLHLSLQGLENERNQFAQHNSELKGQIMVMAKDIENITMSMDQLRTASNSQIQQATCFINELTAKNGQLEAWCRYPYHQ